MREGLKSSSVFISSFLLSWGHSEECVIQKSVCLATLSAIIHCFYTRDFEWESEEGAFLR